MKHSTKPFFILILVFTTTVSLAQHLVSENRLWTQLVYKLPSFDIITESLKIEGDTVINEHLYKKVLQSKDDYLENWNEYGFIRETVDEKVYFRTDTSNQEYLIYDFSVLLNDTIEIFSIISFNSETELRKFNLKVTDIDSILIDNEYRKQFHFINLVAPNTSSEYCVEGIGNMSGLLYWDVGLTGCDNYNLVCYYEDSVLKYHDNNYAS